MAIKPTPGLEVSTHETWWWGDDAIDHEASAGQLSAWCETGDTSGLILRAGQRPSVVKLKTLTPPEVAQLPALDRVVPACYEAARFGLVSVEGLRLRRELRDGIPCLSVEALQSLSTYRAAIPAFRAHYAWMRAYGVDITEQEMADADAPFACDLAQWIGAQVLARTFRGGVRR